MKFPSRFAVVFDAYGTLFDVHSVVKTAETLFPGQGVALSHVWRTKQLEYSFLRTIAAQYIDFWQITEAALAYAAEQLNLALNAKARKQLMDGYLHLEPFAENRAVLRELRQLGADLAILSNGSPMMLEHAVRNAGMDEFFSHILSVDELRRYKPDPLVYQLACKAFNRPAQQITFVSSNGWDISGAGWHGFSTFWVNRQSAPVERLDIAPRQMGRTLDDLLEHLRARTDRPL